VLGLRIPVMATGVMECLRFGIRMTIIVPLGLCDLEWKEGVSHESVQRVIEGKS
jgi:hypothetical protein